MSHHSTRSTQSDTALLPSNVYFQETLSSVSVPSKAGSRTGRRRGSKVRCLIFPLAWLLNGDIVEICTLTPVVHLQKELIITYCHVTAYVHIFSQCYWFLGGRHEQDIGPGYWGGPQYEEDDRPHGQKTVKRPGRSSALQKTVQQTTTGWQEPPYTIRSSHPWIIAILEICTEYVIS